MDVLPISTSSKCTLVFYYTESAFVTKLCSLYRVVKEEISDDNAKLPCFNGRVVSWVGSKYFFVFVLLLLSCPCLLYLCGKQVLQGFPSVGH